MGKDQEASWQSQDFLSSNFKEVVLGFVLFLFSLRQNFSA